VPLLEAATRRNDDVLVVGPPALHDLVDDIGYRFRAGGEPSEAEVANIRERLPVLPLAEASVIGNRDLFGRLATGAMLSEMEQTVRNWRPQLVLRDPCEYSSAIVARRTGTRCAQVAISLAEAEAGSIAAAAPTLEELEPGITDTLFAMRYLSGFPESFDPSPFPTTLRFRAGRQQSLQPLPDWWHTRRGPLIYMTFGTVLGYMSHAADVYRTALNAVGRLDARVLFTVGRRFDVASLGSVPSHVHVEAWVDQASVLGHADVVVCHGGSGTVLGALGAGVPVVAVPVFADQFENSRRIAAAKAGRNVIPHQRGGARSVITVADAPRITAAVQEVLADSSFRFHAGLIADEMAAMRTPDEVYGELATDI
jgi:hypothetical protein